MLFLGVNPNVSFAQFSDEDLNSRVSEDVSNDIMLQTIAFDEPLEKPLTYQLLNTVGDIKAGNDYTGMAVYLGATHIVQIKENKSIKQIKLKSNQTAVLSGDWVGFKGRFETVLLRSKNGDVTISEDSILVSWPAGITPDLTILSGYPDSRAKPSLESPDVTKLKYIHLPKPMRLLCVFVETLYKGIKTFTGLGWGASLILFAILIKLLLFPVSKLTAKFQNEANVHKTALEPIFEDIKKNHKGEVAHNKIMAAYKSRGITPYYSLKPFLATMISLPVLIAIFNMLGEIEPLRDSSFLWIESLAYNDKIMTIPISLPIFGSALNLLPFLMAGVTFLSANKLKNATASSREIKRQKRNLYMMGSVFFLVFYPFPSAMVMYWTLSTAMQFGVSQFSKSAQE